MWACPDDLIDMYSELSPPISSTQVYNNADLRCEIFPRLFSVLYLFKLSVLHSVSDLRIEPFETLLHSKIDDFVTKWQALDTTMLRKKKKREGNRGRLVGSMHLALPFGLDLWDIKGSFRNTKHDRIPEECKVDKDQYGNVSPCHVMSCGVCRKSTIDDWTKYFVKSLGSLSLNNR